MYLAFIHKKRLGKNSVRSCERGNFGVCGERDSLLIVCTQTLYARNDSVKIVLEVAREGTLAFIVRKLWC